MTTSTTPQGTAGGLCHRPRLKLMIQGVFTGLRVLFWAVVLLVGCMYLLGVVTRTLFGNEEDLDVMQEFSDVPAAMFTCFRCFTDGCAATNGTPLQEHLRDSAELFHSFHSSAVADVLSVNSRKMCGRHSKRASLSS